MSFPGGFLSHVLGRIHSQTWMLEGLLQNPWDWCGTNSSKDSDIFVEDSVSVTNRIIPSMT